ncbi:hypothetical protein Tco_0871033 [Tanacetum coccineum]
MRTMNTDDDKENVDEEEYDDLYKDVDVKSLGAEHEKKEKVMQKITDADQEYNIPPVVDEVASMMNVKIRQEESSPQAPLLFTMPVIAIPETSTSTCTTVMKSKVKLPQCLTKQVSDFATPVIQSTINESLENVVLAKSSSQPKSTYKAAESLT